MSADAGIEPTGARPLLDLQRMESALVRATLDHPDVLPARDVQRLRYLLSFAHLTVFQPGAADGGRRVPGRADIDVEAEVRDLRAQVTAALSAPLREEPDPIERLRGAGAALGALVAPLEETRRRLLDKHAGDLAAGELDAEVGRKVLVNVAGGGGGAGFVYVGAWARLEEMGIVPGYLIGASIGSVLGIFRARDVPGRPQQWRDIAASLDRRELFVPLSVRRRYGLPGLLSLSLESLAPEFRRADGERMRMSDLPMPFEAVVGGVRRRSFDRLPRRFRRRSPPPAQAHPQERRSPRMLAPAIAARMWQVAAFFDPRLVKPVVLGEEGLTADFDVLDAAGFSAAIPGVLHYDLDGTDPARDKLLDDLMEREDLAALVDGGVTANVPAEIAWRRVQAGKLGTRNAFFLAFDCFHPQWEPSQLWLQPITQAVQLQMVRNAQFADWIVRFEPTLSPINLVPEPDRLDQAIEWGRASVEEQLPMIRRMLEPVAWDGRGR